MQQQAQNYQRDELSLFLENAINPDSNIRRQTEYEINYICDRNFGQFLIELSKKISTEQEKKIVRQMSATIIKNMLNKEEYSSQWFKLNDKIKTVVKNNILSTFVSSDIDIRKAAALTVAGICKIEIPQKQWLNIFNTLSNMCQNEDIDVRLSSVTCLEYIFKEIKQSDLSLETNNLLNTFYSLLDVVSQFVGNNYPLEIIKMGASILKSIIKKFGKEFAFHGFNFNRIIKLFLGLFNNNLPDEVYYTVLITLNDLCESVDWKKGDNTNVLSNNMKSLCDIILPLCTKTYLYNNCSNVIQVAYSLLKTLGERSALDVKGYMTTIFIGLTSMFEQTLKRDELFYKEMAENYQEYLADTIQGFLETETADLKTTAALFYKVIESFKVRNGLYVDGILLIGSIGKYTKSYFEVVMKIISPYLIQGIESTDLSISKASIISDLFTHSKKGVFEYFKDIFAIIKKTMKATEIDLPDDSDQDNINILIDLREHILENITCMFSALKGKEAQINDFALNACNIILYIEKITKNSLYNSQSVLVQSLCLIADFCNTYKDKFLPFLLKKDDVNNIIEKIEKNLIVKEEPKVLKELDWAKDVINKIICLRDES